MFIEKVSRSEKVARQMTKAIATVLRHVRFDNRYTAVNISRVSVSRDLKNAKVFYTCFNALMDDGDSQLQLAKALQTDLQTIRYEVSRVIVMKYMPKLSFVYDKEAVRSQRVDAILDHIATQQDTIA